MKIRILKVETLLPTIEGDFNSLANQIGCKAKFAIVDGSPKFNVYEVIDKEKFFLSVVKHGIDYEEVDWNLVDYS